MKIITIRDEKAYEANIVLYYWFYIGVGIFFGVSSTLMIQGYVYPALVACLFQIACGVWWYAYHLQRKKLIEVKSV